MISRNPNIGKEHLVEPHAAINLVDRPDLHSWRVHVKDEHRDAAMLGLVEIGASNDQAALTHMGQRGPHLLTIENPFVTVKDGSRLEARHVGTGARFGKHLTPDLFCSDHFRLVRAPLFVRAVLVQHRQCHAVRDRELASHHWERPGFLAPDSFVCPRKSLAPVLRRVRQPGETGFDQCTLKLFGRGQSFFGPRVVALGDVDPRGVLS